MIFNIVHKGPLRFNAMNPDNSKVYLIDNYVYKCLNIRESYLNLQDWLGGPIVI